MLGRLLKIEDGSIRFKEDVRKVVDGFITVICRLLKMCIYEKGASARRVTTRADLAGKFVFPLVLFLSYNNFSFIGFH